MAKREQAPNKTVYLALAIIVILTLAVIGSVYLYIQKSNAYSQEANAYSSLNSNYTTAKVQISNLESQVSTLQTQLSSNKTLLLNVSKKYNATEYNLTHPYVEILANQKVVSIGPETYNYTVGSYEPPSYNFSFNAPYPGYLIVNYSVAPINNNLENSTFAIYVSKEKPYFSGGVVDLNSYIQPYTRYAGPNGETAIFPVVNGTNYVMLTNYYNTTITAEFSMKYVGFHTS